ADAGALAGTKGQIAVLRPLLRGVAHPALGPELLGLVPVLRAVVHAVGKHHDAVARPDLVAVDFIGLSGDADEGPDRWVKPHRLLNDRARVGQRGVIRCRWIAV